MLNKSTQTVENYAQKYYSLVMITPSQCRAARGLLNWTQKDLKEFACKDVMRLSGSERENSLAFVHGYRLGKMNTTQYEIEALAAITDKFIDHCLDNPNDNALAAFEKIGN